MNAVERERAALRHAFCAAYLRTMSPEAAAAECGIRDGYEMLGRETVRRELQKMRGHFAGITREDVIRRLAELAFAPANDAIRLAYLDDPAREVDGLNLSSVAEFRHNSAGSVEIRFIDRIKALDALYTLLEGGAESDEAAAFFRALEEAGGAEMEWRE